MGSFPETRIDPKSVHSKLSLLMLNNFSGLEVSCPSLYEWL